MDKEHHLKHLVKELVIIIFSVIVAVILVKTGAIHQLISSVQGFGL